jgi:hypothetical protein
MYLPSFVVGLTMAVVELFFYTNLFVFNFTGMAVVLKSIIVTAKRRASAANIDVQLSVFFKKKSTFHCTYL